MFRLTGINHFQPLLFGMTGKRQASISSFFSQPKKRELDEKEVIKIEDSPEPDDSTGGVTKRRKISPTSNQAVNALFDDEYPPMDHPSYHPPPGPTFNHPFQIPSIPQHLRETLKFNTTGREIKNKELGLDLVYFDKFIDKSSSRELTNYLLDSLPWYRVKYTVRGININTPRYTTVFGKDMTNTPWTGYDKAEPRAIPRILLTLMQQGESDESR